SGLNAFPNDSGATITYSLSAATEYFSFNRVDFSGNLRWAANNFQILLSGYYYYTCSDNSNGFYVTSCTGGLGNPIYAQHYNLDGTSSFATELNASQGAGGRGNDPWKMLCDSAHNLYLYWGCYFPDDIFMVKISPSGNFLWGSGYITVCGFTGAQILP